MKAKQILLSITILFALVFGMPRSLAQAQDPYPPDGFVLFMSQPGIEVFRKEYPGGNPDYVIVADLTRRISIHILAGKPVPAPGGVAPEQAYFERKPLSQIWEEYKTGNSRAYCVINGSFFNPDIDPTSLNYPMQLAGKWITKGTQQEPSDQLRMLTLDGEEVQIFPFNPGETPAAAKNNSLGGLAETADVSGDDLIGRTFLATADRDGNGKTETLLILTSKTTNAKDASTVLQSFGAVSLMMMSAGDFAQVMCDGKPIVYAEGEIPQAIGLSFGDVKPYEYSEAGKSDWRVLIEGEATELTLTVKNRGLDTWKPGEVALVNVKNPFSDQTRLELQGEVPPNATATFTWQTAPFNKAGVFVSQWTMEHNGQKMSDQPANLNIVVLTQNMGDKKEELEALIQGWVKEKRADLEALILEWISGQIKQGINKICPFSASLPALTVASVFLLKRNIRRRRDDS